MTDESDAKPAAQVELDAQVKPGAQVKPAAKHKKSNALLNVMIAISAIAMIGALGYYIMDNKRLRLKKVISSKFFYITILNIALLQA